MGDQGVDLGRGNIRMAQHDLNGTKIRPTFQQMGGKGMSQGVGRNFFKDTGLSAVLVQDLPKSLTGQTSTPIVDKDPGDPGLFKQERAAFLKIFHQALGGRFTNRDQSFFGTLTHSANKMGLQFQLIQGQGDQFGDPKTGGIEDFQHGRIS
jgi:hypothetical protein